MCDKCDMDFDVDENPGALIFSPPFKVMVTGHTAAEKFHVCPKCYPDVLKWIKQKEEKP